MQNSANKNISFTLEDHGQEFDFMWTNESGKNVDGKAYLQLPETPDSQESIFLDDEELDCESELYSQIYDELREYFYSQFKDEYCAKASARLARQICHVEKIDNYFYTLDEYQNWYVLEEGRLSGYYNVFYFESSLLWSESNPEKFNSLLKIAQSNTVDKIVASIKNSNQEYGSNMADDADNGRIKAILSEYGLDDDVDALEKALDEIYQKIREAEQGLY